MQVTIPAGESIVYVPIEMLKMTPEGDEVIEFHFDFIDICSSFPDQLNVTISDVTDLYVNSKSLLYEDI